jgi:hypothetical protein
LQVEEAGQQIWDKKNSRGDLAMKKEDENQD